MGHDAGDSLRGKRICLVTPGPVGSGPRLVKEANTLCAAGADVTVVSLRLTDLPAVHARDAAVMAAASWRLVQLGPRGRLESLARALLQRVCQRLVRAGLRTPVILAQALDRHVDRLARAAAAVPADLYIAHNLAALPAAWRAARRHGLPLAFDAEDFHSGELRDTPGKAAQRALTEAVERRFMPACDYVTAASPGIADAYAALCGIPRPVVVLNVFPLAHAVAEATPAGRCQPGPSLYWFSQAIGPDRGLEEIITAVARSRSRPHLYLRGGVGDDYRNELQARAVALGLADRLHFLPPAEPDEMSRLAGQHDIGLATETMETLNHRICLSNKLFTYLLAGLPVLASATPAQAALAAELPGVIGTYPPGDPDALAGLIDGLLQRPERLAEARRQALDAGLTRFNWAHEQAAFMACVRRAIAPRPST